jgi:hypothetical protein
MEADRHPALPRARLASRESYHEAARCRLKRLPMSSSTNDRAFCEHDSGGSFCSDADRSLGARVVEQALEGAASTLYRGFVLKEARCMVAGQHDPV